MSADTQREVMRHNLNDMLVQAKQEAPEPAPVMSVIPEGVINKEGLYIPTIPEIAACRGEWLFADGGVLGPNPSEIGGSWAFCRVVDGVQVDTRSGVVLPQKIGMRTVSNNISELYAIIAGIKSLPPDWRGTIVTDSLVTLRRRFPGAKMNGVPDAMARFARLYFDKVIDNGCRFTLVDGHPTKEHLLTGFGKRGNRVSKWNKWCDTGCNEAGKAYLATIKPEVISDED